MSLDDTLEDISPLFNFANNDPIFLELSSISRFFAWVACDPPRALDVSSKSLVSVAITGLSSAAKESENSGQYQHSKTSINYCFVAP
jgi:hypothetical protein